LLSAAKGGKGESFRCFTASPGDLLAGEQCAAQIKPETLESAKYIFVFTTARHEDLSGEQALWAYRGCRQIELVLKRLESILGLGHLRKTDPEAWKAWLQGKLLVAFLVEALIRCGESFFSWGWPLYGALPGGLSSERFQCAGP
jgi:hypothetical protein